jgi:hypothetical protein
MVVQNTSCHGGYQIAMPKAGKALHLKGKSGAETRGSRTARIGRVRGRAYDHDDQHIE